MHLRRLSIQNLRNLTADLDDLARFNIFFGANGSGKTSVLEAVYFLGMGRSFRSPTARSVIRYDAEALTVFAGLDEGGDRPSSPVRLGLSRNSRGELNLRRNGEPVRTLAELARLLPVLLVNAETFGLLDGAPRLRRQFLDWGVFHVEQDFYPAWKALVRSLKHRNSLLRHGKINPRELDVWDAQLAEAAGILHACRERYWQAFSPVLEAVFRDLGAIEGLGVQYAPGWDVSLPYREVLARQREKDMAQRLTTVGPHRADLVFRYKGHPAADILSRGQKKMVVMGLRLAQAETLHAGTGRQCVFLLDDLPAELDPAALARVAGWLGQRKNQVFITTILPEAVAWPAAAGEQTHWFHVEQGQIRILPGSLPEKYYKEEAP